MEDLRTRKQAYLRQNILDQNYDAEEFMEFCENTKGSIDIDSWTFNELVEMVRQFIAQVKRDNARKQQIFSPYSSPSNLQVKHQVVDQFNNWSDFYAPSQKVENKSLDFNLIDLDFLQGLGNGSNKTDPPKNNINVSSNNSTNVNRKPDSQNFMTVPADIAKRLQSGNQTFMSGYNNPNQYIENKQMATNGSPFGEYEKGHIKQQGDGGYQKNEKPKLNPVPKDTQSFECEIETRKIAAKTRINGTQQAVVNGHQIVNPNVFVPNYVLYTFTINPLNIQVKRRMKDFQTIRALLKKLFPAIQIPHLQRFGRLSETEPTIIKKQKFFIESFLNNLIINEKIRCKLLEDFLLCQDQNTLKKIFKEYDKFQKPRSIETTFSHDGKAKIRYNETHRRYIQQQTAYVDYLQSNMNRLKSLYDQVISGLVQTFKLLTQISEGFDGLRENTKNINSNFPEQYKLPQLQRTFQCISSLNKDWASAVKAQAKIVESQARHICRYQYDNAETIQEVLKIHENVVFDGFCRRTQKSDSYKDSYQSKKLAEYKNSLENPSKNPTVLKYQAGFLQQQTVSELKRYLRDLSYKMNHKFNLFSILQLNINNDLDASCKGFQNRVKSV